MRPIHSIVGAHLAMMAILMATCLHGCAGYGGNSGAAPAFTGEEIVGKLTSNSSSVTALASAVTASFVSLGTDSAASPLNGFPADPTIASIVANQQKAANAGDPTVFATLTQVHGALGTSMPSLDAFTSALNTFTSTHYNGNQAHLRTLARLMVLTGSEVPETPPTLSRTSTLQPYQFYYVALWSMIEYEAITRDELFCQEARRYERLVRFYETPPMNATISPSDLANLKKKAADLRKLCHEQ